jgi:hypothetical protein
VRFIGDYFVGIFRTELTHQAEAAYKYSNFHISVRGLCLFTISSQYFVAFKSVDAWVGKRTSGTVKSRIKA